MKKQEKNKMHFFDIEEAKEHGVNKAILLQHFRYLLNNIKANNKDIHKSKEGRYHHWVYSSNTALKKIFPYMKPRSINRWLTELEENGVIKSGIFNKTKYDRTKWYTINGEFGVTFTDNKINNIDEELEEISIVSEYEVRQAKMANDISQNGSPILDKSNKTELLSNSGSDLKNHHNTENLKKNIFVFSDAIQKLKESTSRPNQIIAIFLKYLKEEYKHEIASKEEFNMILRQNLRIAKVLGAHFYEDKYYYDLFEFTGEQLARIDGEKNYEVNPRFFNNIATAYKFKGEFEAEYQKYEKVTEKPTELE